MNCACTIAPLLPGLITVPYTSTFCHGYKVPRTAPSATTVGGPSSSWTVMVCAAAFTAVMRPSTLTCTAGGVMTGAVAVGWICAGRGGTTTAVAVGWICAGDGGATIAVAVAWVCTGVGGVTGAVAVGWYCAVEPLPLPCYRAATELFW